ncbi:XRE family transcriptional regulator [Isoptericola croceus]|uniref:XRE family transcriptional regulator n=1 Tax=Isoptericola croceus TaxID=3031406 RepID=UPI0023F7D046|nr:XRE family transcriptional regulator [Isoptericola croceus]
MDAAQSIDPSDQFVGPGRDAASLVREARARRGLTQRALADRTGVAQTTIARIESGRHQPSLGMLSRLLAGAGFRPRIDLVNAVPPSRLLIEHRDAVVDAARRHKMDRVQVFGSVARGEDGPSSDLDLLVTPRDDATLFDRSAFAAEVEDLLGVHVDVVSSTALRPPRDVYIRRDARDL